LLVHLHLAASLANCGYVEFPHDPPSGYTAASRDAMLVEPVTIDEDGNVHVPERPGFGFVLDEERVAHHTVHTIEQGDCSFASLAGGASRA
jgi:L-alanine-DL-glutamate epimerase-like enolase superfamily enzyme